MANFHQKTFEVYDDYMTPKHAWENIKHLIPKNKIIWEAFFGDGESGKHLKDLGFETIGEFLHKEVDFFENNLGDIIVSNPPFAKIKVILERLLIIDKPFVLILPSSKINTVYFRAWKDKHIQIIIPRKRIHFLKLIDGEISTKKSCCNFDCFYYCYKMNMTEI